MSFSRKLKYWMKDKFKIYLPHEFKVPLTWFILSSIIGIIIQSSKANHFVFIDFFYNNYILWLDYVSTFLDASFLLGFGVVFSFLITTAYYAAATISLIVLLFRIIISLDKRNTKKIVGWIIIIGIIIFVFVKYSPSLNLDIINITKNETCPEGIIPETMSFKIADGLQIVVSSPGGAYLTKWNDSQPVKKYGDKLSYGVVCKNGFSEGQNVNYYYCNDLYYQKSVTPIADNGVIGKTVNTEYIISLVLQEKSRMFFKGLGNTYGVFEVIDAQCKKPS